MNHRALFLALLAAGAGVPGTGQAQDCSRMFVYSVNQICRTLSNGFSQCQPVGMVGPAPNCAAPGVPPLMPMPLAPASLQAPMPFNYLAPFPAAAAQAVPVPAAPIPGAAPEPAAPVGAGKPVAQTSASVAARPEAQPQSAAPAQAQAPAAVTVAAPVVAVAPALAVQASPAAVAPAAPVTPAPTASDAAPVNASPAPVATVASAPKPEASAAAPVPSVPAVPAMKAAAKPAEPSTPAQVPVPAPVAAPPAAPVAAAPASPPPRVMATPAPAAVPAAVEAPEVSPRAPAPRAAFTLEEGLAHFDFDHAELSSRGVAELDAWLEKSRAGGKTLRVTGHADRIGTASYNLKLSGRRAESVKKYLVGKGLAGKDIKLVAKGEAEPVKYCRGGATAATIACLAPNRRVEIDPE